MFAAKNELFTRPSGYQISRSVRLRSSASGYFNRTPASATNQQKWTWSGWVKRGVLSSSATLDLFDCQIDANNWFSFWFYQDKIAYDISWTTTANRIFLTSSSVYRDTSAWYHLVISVDTTQATAANRILIYINGQSVALNTYAVGSGYVTQNTNLAINSTSVHSIGRRGTANDSYFDGYITETNLIDGQQLTPSSFGQYNANGVWSPIKYAGTYGTNGFYLNFSDNSGVTATTIGKDNSGNGNNWTPNNISVTAGVTYDSMLDVPTLYADGGNGRGNYAVLNPILTSSVAAPTNANLTSSSTDAANQSSFPMQTGKWYAEATLTTLGSQDVTVGITSTISSLSTVASTNGYGWGVKLGRKWINAVVTTGFSTAVAGDIAGLAFNADTGQLDVYKNNVSVFSITGIPTGIIYNFVNGAGGTAGTNTINWNFGQRPFTYTPPTGFVALNTQNLSTPTIANGAAYMAATTYTGNLTGQSITNGGNNTLGITFTPDLVWIKSRSAATNNKLIDSVRGATNALISNTTGAETTDLTGVTSLNSNGFTLGVSTDYNNTGATYVGWQWKAGTTSASNTNGTITSTVSVGATQGFSVVTYTGTGANATVGHGLGVAPSMIIVKARSVAGQNWLVYSSVLGATQYLILDLTNAAGTASTPWNNTAPTSSVFSVGTSSGSNTSGTTYVAYCFSEVAGYSKFGSYTGNGSADGPFVYLGFRPRWVMVKRTDTTGDWVILDTSRSQSNAMANRLYLNLSQAEDSTPDIIDTLSNGFKLRIASAYNVSAGTYIYAAFAENPFKYSLAR